MATLKIEAKELVTACKNEITWAKRTPYANDLKKEIKHLSDILELAKYADKLGKCVSVDHKDFILLKGYFAHCESDEKFYFNVKK